MKRIVLLVAGLLLAAMVQAADNVSAETAARLKSVLSKIMPGSSPDAIKGTPIAGLYEISFGPQIYYMSEDGRYLVTGEMFDVERRTSVTEERRAKARLAALKALDESTMIVYPAKGKAKHTITVFTDIDCGYCRKLHQGMAEMNELGITVRYLSFPRAGVGSESYKKAVDVWCAADRNKALTMAKNSQPVTGTKSCDAPIQKHLELVRVFNITGTPAILMEDGRLMPGYLPPKELLAAIEGKR